MVINSQGLGMAVDLSVFDQLAGIQSGPACLEVFDNAAGSFWHLLFGALTAMLPDGWAIAGATAFGAYEFSKVEGGKPMGQVAGALLEFALGAGLAALLMRVK